MPRRRTPTADLDDVATLRVAKTIGRAQDGAKRHTLKHGSALVCVRHRINPAINMRFVTVELVVEALPVASRNNTQVAVRIGATERTMRVNLLACGAIWDATDKVWRMTRSVARTFRLLRQIVPRKTGP